MKLLAIPNDPTAAYSRNYKEDFLSEFNPRDKNSSRVFDEVKFINWKDKKTESHFGIDSIPFLKDKTEARALMNQLISEEKKFDSPMFTNIFKKDFGEIENFMKNYNTDVVRAFNTHFAAELGAIIKEKYDLPLIVSAHDPSRLTPAIASADSLVCISNNLADISVGYGVDRSKITIIPDGIDMDSFSPKKEDKVGIDAKYKILSVGRIVPSKNIESLLESVSMLNKELGGVKHIHLGNGSPEALTQINKKKSEVGLENISYFTGGIQKELLPFYYSWADLYSLPTLWEGLGRAQIESLACGTPVVTSNIAPMTEVIQDGYNGLTANPNDPKDFANKMKKYFTDKNLRDYLSENSRKSVVRKYGMKEVMQMHAQNYKDLVGNKNKYYGSLK